MGRVESRRVEFLSHSPKPRIDVIEHFNNKPVDLIALIVARTMPSTIFRPEFTTIRMEKK